MTSATDEGSAKMKLIYKRGNVEVWQVDGEYLVYGYYDSGDPRVCPSLGMAMEVAAGCQ